MIKIEHHQGIYAPLCYCDVCGERIVDAHQAIVLYPHFAEKGTGKSVEIMHVHKGKCDQRATNSYGDDGGSDELSTHLVYLLNNVGLRGDSLKSLIDRVEKIGM